MVDLGLFNFVKNSLAQGKTREVIISDLVKGGWNQTDIDAALLEVQNGQLPSSVIKIAPGPELRSRSKSTWSIAILIILCVLGGIGFYYLHGTPNFWILFPQSSTIITFNETPVDTHDWNTYSNGQYGFSFSYPPELKALDIQLNDKYGPVEQVVLREDVVSSSGTSLVDHIKLLVRPKDQISVLKEPLGKVKSTSTFSIHGIDVTVTSSVVTVNIAGESSSSPWIRAVFVMGNYAYVLGADEKYSNDLYSMLSSFK